MTHRLCESQGEKQVSKCLAFGKWSKVARRDWVVLPFSSKPEKKKKNSKEETVAKS